MLFNQGTKYDMNPDGKPLWGMISAKYTQSDEVNDVEIKQAIHHDERF